MSTPAWLLQVAAFCFLTAICCYAEDCKILDSDPVHVAGYQSDVGKCLEFDVTGDTSGSVWGSDIYTADSMVRTAAVHAGIVPAGETKRVRVRLLPEQTSFQSTTRNGVRTIAYSNYPLGYQFIGASDIGKVCTALSSTPSSLSGYSAHIGKCYEFELAGDDTSGSAWGSDIYTGDSSLSKAAVHAGVVNNGKVRLVRVRVLPGQSSYQSTTRNGVTTSSYGAYGLSFEFIGSSDLPDTCTPLSTAPSSLAGYSAHIGKCYEFELAGDDTSGSAWGSDIYTGDSSLSKAAVHAGVVTNGKVRLVRVRVLPGQSSYQSTTRNGVTTSSYGAYGLSFEFNGSSDLPDTCTALSSTPSSLSGYSAHIGKCYEFELTGAMSGTAWGSDIYTGDSSLSIAAVHAGMVSDGKTRLVRVRVLPGQSSYQSTTRHGVTTASYGAYGLSFEFIGSSEVPDTCRPVSPAPGSLSGYASNVEKCFELVLTGTTSGTIWGSDIYTADSTLGAAAVHAGVLRSGETGPVHVRVLPGQSSYQATTRNDITSNSYGSYTLSFEFPERPR